MVTGFNASLGHLRGILGTHWRYLVTTLVSLVHLEVILEYYFSSIIFGNVVFHLQMGVVPILPHMSNCPNNEPIWLIVAPELLQEPRHPLEGAEGADTFSLLNSCRYSSSS